MNSTALLLTLRIIHILSGIFWVGGAIVVAQFILPSIFAAGPAGGAVMTQLTQVRKLPLRVLTAGWLTVLSGSVLYMRNGSIGGDAWYSSPSGRVFGIGGALGLIVILMGTFGNLPVSKKMGALGAAIQAGGGTPTPEQTAEMQRLRGRLTTLMNLAAVGLVLAATAMAIARYWT